MAIANFWKEHLDRRLGNVNDDDLENALISMGVAAFVVIYKNKRNRKILLEECHAIFCGITDQTVEDDAARKALSDVIEAMVCDA